MFNDKYGLTQAVLDGRKTMTRRMVCTKDVRLPVHLSYDIKTRQLLLYDACLSLVESSRYAFDEVVAIAQAYKDIYEKGGFDMHEPFTFVSESAGWKNKMFVKAELMPHHIKITNIYIERLQDISEEDCYKEGIYKIEYSHNGPKVAYTYRGGRISDWKDTPQEAFAALIDKVSGKGTWDSNPIVWVYEFVKIE